MKDVNVVNIHSEKQRIRKVIQGEVDAENKHDLDASVKNIHQDFIMLYPNVPIMKGLESYRERVKEALKVIVSIDEFELLHVGVSSSGDMGYAVGTVKWTAEGPDGRVIESGKWHRTLVKEDGEWKLAVLSWNP